MGYLKFIIGTLWFISHLSFASPTNPVDGLEYKTLASPQTVPNIGKKVEVIEFFMYHCPACNLLEPQLLDWIKKQGDNIVFRRIHLPHNGSKDVESHLFLTLEALQKENDMHAKILATWHVQHLQLTTDADNIEWAVNNGFDRQQFMDAYNSFSVMTKLQNLLHVSEGYHVNSTPALVIDGRYVIGPALIQDNNKELKVDELPKALLQVADVLVEKAKAGK